MNSILLIRNLNEKIRNKLVLIKTELLQTYFTTNAGCFPLCLILLVTWAGQQMCLTMNNWQRSPNCHMRLSLFFSQKTDHFSTLLNFFDRKLGTQPFLVKRRSTLPLRTLTSSVKNIVAATQSKTWNMTKRNSLTKLIGPSGLLIPMNYSQSCGTTSLSTMCEQQTKEESSQSNCRT